MLRERIAVQPKYEKERKILTLAEKEPGSWAAGMKMKWAELPAQAQPPWRSAGKQPPTKLQMQYYSKHRLLPSILSVSDASKKHLSRLTQLQRFPSTLCLMNV